MQCFQGVPEKMTSEALYGPAGKSFTDGEGVSILLKARVERPECIMGV